MLISLTKEKMESLFLQFLQDVFKHPEVISCCVKKIVITRETLEESGRKAFDASFHDLYSDVDLSVRVRLPKDGSVTAGEYTKRIDRFGVTEDTALGWMLVPENQVYRIIFYNGMRYDFIFEFEYSDDASLTLEDAPASVEDNAAWPFENINRFWFIQLQASLKGIHADSCHAVADDHGGQDGTALKCTSADARHAVGDGHGGQTGTAIESTIPYACHIIGNRGVLAT